MKIRNLKGISITQILDVFNASFSDYFVPFILTKEQLNSKIASDNIDFELSVGAFENKKLIAFILHGTDIIDNVSIAYNGGTGVIPAKRGLGLTKSMYQFILPILEKRRISKITLEVISKNTAAIKSYEKIGFMTTRTLACFKGSFDPIKTNEEFVIKELIDYPWDVLQSFWDIQTTWQNSRNVINKLITCNHALGAYKDDALVGYVIHSPISKRIQQIAIHKNFRRRGIAKQLLTGITTKYGKDLFIVNVDKKSTNTINFFRSIGLDNYIDQLEMELTLNE
ncbi:MAG: GNAT family N-acetyltransferase [Crocinitomicaceae bacterium]|nr:GNAT family N-acetyltransferase [Crocinitomicaceae bacterium]